MKLSAHWIRDFVELAVDDRQLAQDLTNVGIGVEGTTGSGVDTVFETEIGTNRPDAMNHYGVAREAAAVYDVPLKPVGPQLPASTGTASFPIVVEEPELCPRFSARIIRDARIKSSPAKIAHRLQLLDQRPISNAVDATNYVLWEIGKPTHVFDLDLLEGGKIIVRKAREGERLKTLDGVERKLTTEDLVVCDAKRPVGLAGVMGGHDTMITEKTRNILIESAWWDPITIRKASRRHALHTDASHRFERGADFESTAVSCDRVAELILASGGGNLAGGIIDVVSKKMDQAPVVLHVSEVRRILGGSLDGGEVFRILKKLGFIVIPEGQADAEFRVQIPSWRLDVEREIDLIEEVARLYGYDKFESTLPAYSGAVVDTPHAGMEATLRARALALGYNQAVSLTFISHADAEAFSSASVLELENPLSEEASVMRTSLLPGMLDMLAWNLNRGVEDARLFEIAPVYEKTDEGRIEPRRMALGATFRAVRDALPAGEELDVSKGEQAASGEAFRAFKGDVDNLLCAFQSEQLTYDRPAAECFHFGRSARALIDGKVVAQFGQLHPQLAAGRKLRQDVYVAELDLDQLYACGLRSVKYRPLGKYPAVERDFSFIFAEVISFGEVRNAVQSLHVAELREFRPAEIFRGGSIAAGKYSILLRATLQSDEGTLRDDQIAQLSAKIVTALQGLGGVQRA